MLADIVPCVYMQLLNVHMTLFSLCDTLRLDSVRNPIANITQRDDE